MKPAKFMYNLGIEHFCAGVSARNLKIGEWKAVFKTITAPNTELIAKNDNFYAIINKVILTNPTTAGVRVVLKFGSSTVNTPFLSVIVPAGRTENIELNINTALGIFADGTNAEVCLLYATRPYVKIVKK